MTTRQELIRQWELRLAEAERADGAISWSDRLRQRLYRFLLAMYGGSVWPGASDDVDNSRGRASVSRLVVADDEPTHDGKAPRSRAQILAGLKHVQGLSEELAPPGPLREGLQDDAWVVVYSSPKRQRGSLAYRMLRRAGFQPQLLRKGATSQILVVRTESAKAREALAVGWQTGDSKKRPIGLRRRIGVLPALTFLCVTTTLTLVGLLMLQVWDRPAWLPRTEPESSALIASGAIIFGMLSVIIGVVQDWSRPVAPPPDE